MAVSVPRRVQRLVAWHTGAWIPLHLWSPRRRAWWRHALQPRLGQQANGDDAPGCDM